LPLLYSRDHIKGSDRHKRARSALGIVGLLERSHHHPNQLSGGQQQRVAIARALINDPSILLADEPTGNLDSRTSIEVMDVFQRLNIERGITILLITHEHDIAECGTRTVAFRDGHIVRDEFNEHRRWARRTGGAAAGNGGATPPPALRRKSRPGPLRPGRPELRP
jgi:putative ABC transport system ATP-binding protein